MAKHRKPVEDINEPPLWWYIAAPAVLIGLLVLLGMAV